MATPYPQVNPLDSNRPSQCPYPTTQSMPEPTFNAPLTTDQQCAPYPPPAYSDIMKNPAAAKPENDPLLQPKAWPTKYIKKFWKPLLFL